MTKPYSFDEFFATDQEEIFSPFLKPKSRKWSKNLDLISSLIASLFLIGSFILSYFSPHLSYLSLMFVYFLVGTPALIHTIYDIIHLEINIDVLMTLAAFLSVLIGSAFEGGLLLVLFELSGAMEAMVTKKTRSNLFHLQQISPKIVHIIDDDGHLYEKAAEDVSVGTQILVKSGEIVPLDGIVVQGSSYVNLIHLTGESEPISKTIEDEVPAGAGILDGTLSLRVTKISSDSTLSTIIKLITHAQESKPKVERFLDRFGKPYATTIILLCFSFALLLPYIFNIPYLGHEGSIYRALAFLIAASPCALIIATPTAYLSAMSACAKKGILPKGGTVLDAIIQCKTIALDKTGTVTTGKLVCEDVEHLQGSPIDLTTALQIAASLEKHTVHPIAQAIVLKAQSQKLSLLPIKNFRSIPGYGVEGVIEGKQVIIGNESLIQQKTASHFVNSQKMATYLWIEGTIIAFYFLDTLKPTSKNSIQRLKELGLKVVMLSGDQQFNVQNTARELGIETYFSSLNPEDKLTKIQALSQVSPLMMVGDGINDAPALAQATVGISMGKIGSATAVNASDVILLNDDIGLIDWIYKKAIHTNRILKQNILLALLIIVLTTTPALLGLVPLWIAVVLHEGGTVLVGLNSLRLLRKE